MAICGLLESNIVTAVIAIGAPVTAAVHLAVLGW
jgi:hypothetical protein